MTLTTAQYASLRAAIQADPVLSATPIGGDGDIDIANAFNALAVPDFPVWRPDVPVREIMDTFNFAAFTPSDSLPESNVDQASIQRYNGRLLAIQTKQMNLQLMLQGRESVDASLPNFRAGLRDALINVPAGVNGASVAVAGANAVNALNACTRKGTRAEKLFAGSNATTGTVTAAVMNVAGPISAADVGIARAN